MKKEKVTIAYTSEQFKKKGFEGEVAKFMRENKNTALVGGNIVQFDNWKALSEYRKTTIL